MRPAAAPGNNRNLVILQCVVLKKTHAQFHRQIDSRHICIEQFAICGCLRLRVVFRFQSLLGHKFVSQIKCRTSLTRKGATRTIS